MTILLISGSIGQRSRTRILLEYLRDLLQKQGVQTIWWDLSARPLPIAIPEYYNRPDEHPNKIVRDFAGNVQKADGFILGSPLYHGSYSGVLKNALDNLPGNAFGCKPVGLISHSSNARSCVAPCNYLRPIIRSMGGYATHEQIGTTDGDYKKSVDQKISVTSREIKARGRRLVDELMKLAQLLKQMS